MENKKGSKPDVIIKGLKSECEKCLYLDSDSCEQCMTDSESCNQDQEYYQRRQRPVRLKKLELKYECDECECSFTRSSLLLAHKLKHSDELPFSCSLCTKTFDSKNEWVNHRTSTSCAPQYLYAKQNSFPSEHRQLTRSVGKRFKCSHCSKSFKSACSRKEHERNIHNTLRQHSCNECGKSFYKKFNLNIHKEIHSETRSHACNICGKKFKTSQGIRMHMEIHSDERHFMCEVCGKVFKTKAVLESHTAIHTGETKYTCNTCGKAYRYRSSLFIHMRTHSGQRPHTCKICNATFIVKSHLTDHMRSHTGEHPFVCIFCSTSFTRAISLKKHLKSHIKAGSNVNIDSAMYHAKLQAFVLPRDSCRSAHRQSSSHSVPRLTHFIKENVFVNGSKAVPVQDISLERVELYVDQPTEEKDLIVIKVSSIDDTGLHIKSIVQTSSPSGHEISERNVKHEKLCYREEKDIHKRKLLQVKTKVNKGNISKEIKEKTPQSENLKVASEMSGSSSSDCLSKDHTNEWKKVKIEKGNDWPDSQGLIVDHILKLDVESNAMENHPLEENKKVVVSMTSNGSLSNQNHPSSIFRVKEEADDDIAIGNHCVEEPSLYLEHQELLLQKCSVCENMFKCKIFAEGGEICQECRSRQELQKLDKLDNHKSVIRFEYGSHESKIREHGNESLSKMESKPYHCDVCGASFEFRSVLRKHAKQHSKYPHVCKKCGQSFQQEMFFLKHHCETSTKNPHVSEKSDRQMCENATEYKCDECGKIFHKKFILKIHKRKHTGKKPYKCKLCSKRFISASHRKVHMRRHTKEQGYKGHSSDKIFNERTEFLQHVRSPQEKQCTLQDVKIRQEPFDKTSEAVTEVANVEIKSETPWQDNTKTEFVEERDDAEKGLPHSNSMKCRFCSRTFKYLSVLQTHERSHTGEKPFSCTICNKAFSKKNNMKIHMRVHTGERPFLCDICGKYFAYKYTLEAHTRVHTHERPFSCNICGKTFSHEGNKSIHMKRHLEEKMFKCDLCPKAFVAKIGLDCHRRTHTGEKPFNCDVCGRSFRVRHHLTEHRRRHTGEKPYSCELCKMSFARFGTKKAHMKKHLDDAGQMC